ncbi:hypothetical protein V8E53_005367 [Lactarius tabidus]
MSPESEDSFTLAAGDLPGSQYSFGINTGLLPEYQDDSVIDVLPLLEDQDIEMDADVSENGSSSPQSQYSFSINSMPLPELEDNHVLPAAHILGVQDEVLEYPPLQPAATPGAQECEPTMHDKNFSKPSATPGNLRVDPAPPAEAEGVTGNCVTAHAWIWGERAPSFSNTQTQEGKENTNWIDFGSSTPMILTDFHN